MSGSSKPPDWRSTSPTRIAPWQRGTNENTNGLLRQYFPKGADLNAVSDERLVEVADELNNRPRLVLGDRSPAQLMRRWLQPPIRNDD